MIKCKINSVIQLKRELQKLSNPVQEKVLRRFFKTGEGEYGEGDIFLGVLVPIQRKLAVNFINLNLEDLEQLLKSKIHEYRFIALIILIKKYEKADLRDRKRIFSFYLKNSKNINNWDLVDVSAPKIVGDYLKENSRSILYEFAESQNLWQRRIAIISTLTFIRNNDFSDTLKISKILLLDNHNLIQKAVGWMLREVGKRNQEIEEKFLKKYSFQMQRVTLRYAIEKFEKNKKEFYLKR